jgi:hypothetical protein
MLQAPRSWTAEAMVTASRIYMLTLAAVPRRRVTHQKQHPSQRAAVHHGTPRRLPRYASGYMMLVESDVPGWYPGLLP